MFLDRGLTLPLERRIQQCKLPARRGLSRNNSVLPAIEMQVFRLIPYIMQRGKPRTDMKVHVGQVAVLCDVKSNPNSGRISVFDIEVDVAHR